MGTDIYNGNVEIAPFTEGQSSSCDYCPYEAVCGFDRKIKGFQERTAGKLEKSEILDKMQTDNAIDRNKGRKLL